MELSLLSFLTAPISLPIKGFRFILEIIQQEVEKELLNPDNIQEKLLELEYLNEMNDISEEDYLETRQLLLNKLREFKERELAEIE